MIIVTHGFIVSVSVTIHIIVEIGLVKIVSKLMLLFSCIQFTCAILDKVCVAQSKDILPPEVMISPSLRSMVHILTGTKERMLLLIVERI